MPKLEGKQKSGWRRMTVSGLGGFEGWTNRSVRKWRGYVNKLYDFTDLFINPILWIKDALVLVSRSETWEPWTRIVGFG